jgi:hypothetical protein
VSAQSLCLDKCAMLCDLHNPAITKAITRSVTRFWPVLCACMLIIAGLQSGCGVHPLPLYYTWQHQLVLSSPPPLIWRNNWPTIAGQPLPISFYFPREHQVEVQMQPFPNGSILTEWGSFDEPRLASAPSGLPPGSTMVRLTFPEGSQDYFVNSATGSLSVAARPEQDATQPSARREQ